VLGVAVLALGACGGSAGAKDVTAQVTGSGGATAVPMACSVVTVAQVQQAIGVLEPDDVAGPEVLSNTGCAWHSTDPTCTARTLGIEIASGAKASSGYSQAKAAASLRDDVPGLGQEAFESTDLVPFGSAVQIDRLNIRVGKLWVRLTTAGRLGDNGRAMLTSVASEVLANPSLKA
jgi:hypothetical protein